MSACQVDQPTLKSYTMETIGVSKCFFVKRQSKLEQVPENNLDHLRVIRSNAGLRMRAHDLRQFVSSQRLPQSHTNSSRNHTLHTLHTITYITA